jgi:hypothetical protein
MARLLLVVQAGVVASTTAVSALTERSRGALHEGRIQPALSAVGRWSPIGSGEHEPPIPHTVIWRGASLAARRADDTAATKSAIRSLLQSADEALSAGPFAVTNKTVAPPSGSTHDYWSVASYFWPCNVPCNHTLWKDCSRWCEPPLILHDGRSCIPAPPKDNVTCDNSTGLPWASHDGYPRSDDRTGVFSHTHGRVIALNLTH